MSTNGPWTCSELGVEEMVISQEHSISNIFVFRSIVNMQKAFQSTRGKGKQQGKKVVWSSIFNPLSGDLRVVVSKRLTESRKGKAKLLRSHPTGNVLGPQIASLQYVLVLSPFCGDSFWQNDSLNSKTVQSTIFVCSWLVQRAFRKEE